MIWKIYFHDPIFAIARGAMPEKCHVAKATPPQSGDNEEIDNQKILAIGLAPSIEAGLIIAGPCAPWVWEKEPLGEPTGDDRDHTTTVNTPRPILTTDFLPWSSNGLEHGLKRHKIAKNGYVYETGDRPTEPRRKSKALSSRQFAGRC
jgi:hypothetical protein